ncbi:hypothetical protein SAMD00023353_2201550 [Rosellinia necatrix]|uniref:Uncharacterized protein n=1 Tax=Rosellinia necatrix TaxID=77044 RepID=A0A1S7UP35_ROSNE|nr:hypothetical protein SAMD00023353_2201550 [Rosellinia necatrix]
MTRTQQSSTGQEPARNEWNSLGKPQLFVSLTFGVSWSDRHIPQTHTVSYTSKHLKNARNSGHFPRHEPGSHHSQRRQESSSQRQNRGERPHHREHERPRGRAGNPGPRHAERLSPPRDERSGSRRGNNERGSSAPPAVHDDALWNDEEGGVPSATLFPRPSRTLPHASGDLPSNPAGFRLGEDGLPWSVSAWPYEVDDDGLDDEEGEEREPPFANLPTTLPLSPPRRPRGEEDPQRVKELESLSTAMVTVDNGFENQWWNQGTRESIVVLDPKDEEEEDDDDDGMHPISPADALLLSAAEPPSGVETYSPVSESFRDLVSPLSDFSPGFNVSSSLRRSCSTRSDELWMGR